MHTYFQSSTYEGELFQNKKRKLESPAGSEESYISGGLLYMELSKLLQQLAETEYKVYENENTRISF